MTETSQTPSHPPAARPLLAVPPAPSRGWRWLAWAVALAVLAGGGFAGWREFARPPELAVVLPSRGPALEAVYATGVVEAVSVTRWNQLR